MGGVLNRGEGVAEDGAGTSLATFVLPQITTEALEQAARAKERRFALALVTALTVFAFLVDGYHPYAEDGGLYVAGVKRLLDPQLYPYGGAFVTAPMRFSLFAPLVASIVRATHLGLPSVLLVLHLASIWATLFAARMLASRCWRTREARAGAVTLFGCWLGLPVAGTALCLMDPYLTARSLSTPCMVLGLVGALDLTRRGATMRTRRIGLGLWAGSTGIAAAMHPLMAAYGLGASLILMALRSKRGKALWGTLAICSAAVMLAAGVQGCAPQESAEYVRIALTRSYWFITEWTWYEVLGLVAPMAILGWLAKADRFDDATEGARQALIRMAVAGGGAAIAVAVLLARAAVATHLVARMQPLRLFQIVYVVMVLVLGAALGERFLKRAAWRWAALGVLLGGTMLALARAGYADSEHLELPGGHSRNAWTQAFVWIRENTPKDSLFALDPDYINAAGEDAQCFRAIAERSVMADYSKDGGEASIAPALTGEWVAEQSAQKVLSPTRRATDEDRRAALAPLGVSWIVLTADSTTRLDCPYRNGSMAVCRLR